MSKIEPRNLKGFRDYAPKEQLTRQVMFGKIQSVFERFGFMPLSTPVLEYKEILMGKYGDDEKLVYSFKDNGDRDVAMRYDLTVPLARFIAQNQGGLTYPFKRYQIAPVWRAENTQKGRLREFYQCDVDVVGTESRMADAEVMSCICSALETLGIDNYELRVNDRRILFEFLQKQSLTQSEEIDVLRAIDKLDKIGSVGVTELLQEKGLGQITGLLMEFLQEDSMTPDMSLLMDRAMGLGAKNCIFDKTIVRGLDYYTSTVFEIRLSGSEFGSIAGGGRYDKLLDTFSDRSLPAVGGSIGIDRLFEALESIGKVPSTPGVEVAVLNLGELTWPDALRVASKMRNKGVNVDLYYEEARLDKQFKYAESKGARLAVILGMEEKAKGTVKIKNLQTREQIEVREAELLSAIKSS